MDIERIVRTHVSSGEDGVPPELISGLEDGQGSLLGLVKALGEYLTSTDDDIRLRGVKLLTDVIAKVPASKINRQATQTLTSFLTSLVSDGHCLPSTLSGLTALAKLPTFGDGEAVSAYRGVAENVKMRSFVQSTRYLVFKLVDLLVSKHRAALLSLKTDFTASYVKLAEGEKDPRNLMLAFQIGRVVLIDFDEFIAVEDMFDITFCYFPITFKPPPDDPYGITPLDLKLALRSCMASNPRFAPLAMPLFLEKLGPSLGDSKRDVLKSVEACLPVYGAAGLQPFLSDLWDGLKTEILYSPDADIERDALQTFSTLIKVLFPAGEKPTQADLMKAIVKECQDILKEPEKSKAKPATKILGACIEASAFVGSFALSQVLPQLFRAYHTESEIPHRDAILVVISDLLHALREVYTAADSHQTEERSIEIYRDELLSLLTSGLDNPSPTAKTPALSGIVNLAHIPGFLTAEEMAFVVQRINPLLLDITANNLRDEAIQALSAISGLISKPVEDSTLPLLFGKLPDSAPALDNVEDRFMYLQILECLSELCVSPSLFETLVVRVLTKLDLLCEDIEPMEVDGRDPPEIQHEVDVAYAYALINCLLATLRKKIAAKHNDVAKYFDQVIPRIFALCLSGSQSEAANPSIAADIRVLTACASIVELLTQTLTPERQSDFAKLLLHAYNLGGVGEVASKGKHASKELARTSTLPFTKEASLKEQNLVILFSAGIIALRGSTESFSSGVDELLNSLLKWSLESSPDIRISESVAKAISSIVNKRAETLESFLSTLETEFWSAEIAASSQPTDRRGKAVVAWIWIAKGLVVRNHTSGMAMIAQVFQLFEEKDSLADTAARKLVILSDAANDALLSKDNHAVYKSLHKQKLANFLLPALIKGCNQADEAVRRTYMIALGSLIRLIPRSLIVSDLQQILPLLMRSLALPDPEIRSNILEALISVIEVDDSTTSDAIEKQAKGLVERLLPIATELDPSKSSDRTRIAALRCLAVFPDAVRYDVLHPVKSKVIRELRRAIDDPKRLVRKEAVDTRSKWFRYGAAV